MGQLRVTSKSLPEHNRQSNRSLVLQNLFHDGPLSRADLARASGLTRVTISDLVADLGSEGLIAERGLRAAGGVGKPAHLIGIDEDAWHIICLDLASADHFEGAIISLRGTILFRTKIALDNATGGHAIAIALELTRVLIANTNVRILGIGISTPGIIDNGVILEAPNLGWYEQPLAALFTQEFGVPVHVGNDANAGALAVHTFQSPSARSLMLITIEHGVGAGLIIGGALVEGEQFTAGEIGHVVVDDTGERCPCGRHGCLELSVSVPHLKRKVAQAAPDARDSVLAEAGRALGIAIAPIVAALNLNEILLAGPATLVEGQFLATAARTVRERTLSAVSNGLQMRLAADSSDLLLKGAAVLVLAGELGVS